MPLAVLSVIRLCADSRPNYRPMSPLTYSANTCSDDLQVFHRVGTIFDLASVDSEVQMAVGAQSHDGQQGQMQAPLMGVLALLADAREQHVKNDRDAVKTELILARVGMSRDDIATVTGKNKDAVRMAITRAKGI
jgi:hypothetical protein